MNWRWLIYDHIPVDLKVPKAQRRAIRKEVRNSLNIFSSTARALLGLCIGIAALLFLLIAFLIATDYLKSRYPSFDHPLLNIALFAIIGNCLFAGLFRSLYQKKTYQLLRQSGYDICTRCGYSLKGLPEDHNRCPECGTTVPPIATRDRDDPSSSSMP